MRAPNFDNLLAVLRRDVPERPTLFEMFLNRRLYLQLNGLPEDVDDRAQDWPLLTMRAFHALGYDYVPLYGSAFSFPAKAVEKKASRSMNDQAVIYDRASFAAYPWPDPDDSDFSVLQRIGDQLPAGMQIVIIGPGGVLENVMQLVGYESLCYLLLDDPDLVREIFAAVGERLVRYYARCAPYRSVGAMIVNDDWGFNTQTMLSPEDMRTYLFPWHQQIVDTIHGAGRPAILHSCGNLSAVMDDVIAIGYDAKHSYEDAIVPVEEAYERWGARIAHLGGIDVDFLCRATPAEITARAQAMLERAATRGGYALGTGNSVPYYVPDDHYYAMTRAALG